MTILIESTWRRIVNTTSTTVDCLHVRVWRQEKRIQNDYDYNELQVVCFQKHNWTIAGLSKALLEVKGVNAVEVKSSKGHGVVLYKDWP